MAGLANRRWVSPAILALAVLCAASLPPFNPHGAFTLQFASASARFAIMFAAGAVLYQWRDVIPARWWLVGVSVVVVLLSGTVLPNYYLLGGIPLAYAIIASGALIHNKRLQLHTDLSYGVYIYAFPIQQLLVICGIGVLNPVVSAIIATIATLPVAALSWFLIEKPAMSLKSRLMRTRSDPAAADIERDRAANPVDLIADGPTQGVPDPA
jgi:peptidoglycan/LPS O-acetylase OafA/YrhL